jgi:hypothetical protein
MFYSIVTIYLPVFGHPGKENFSPLRGNKKEDTDVSSFCERIARQCGNDGEKSENV